MLTDDQIKEMLEARAARAGGVRLDMILERAMASADAAPPQPRWWRPTMALVGGLGAAVLVALLGVVLLASGLLPGSRGPGPEGVGSSPSPSASQPPSPTVLATPSPTLGMCGPAQLAARITLWEGAAGHRIAHVELTNTTASTPCVVRAMSQPQLVDGHAALLIDGAVPGGSAALTIRPGEVLRTMVQDGNYCGPTPAPPVTVAFVLAGGAGRIVAAPVAANDSAGVPPCLGSPDSAGSIDMHPWAP